MEDIKEKSADEMFEELGYEKEMENKKRIMFIYEGQFFDKYIVFEMIDKHIVIELGTGESTNINMQELKAINKKIEELGWQSCKNVKKTPKKVGKM